MKRLLTFLLCAAPLTQAQSIGPLPAYTMSFPWKGGTTNDALIQSLALTTIPMGSFTFTSPKDSGVYTSVVVGRSPFLRGKTTTPIKVMLVPLIITIGSTTFDPTVTDPCISGAVTSDVAALQNSPIFTNVAFDGGGGVGHASMMNGVNVGTTTYNNAMRRAEFWSAVGGTSYNTTFAVTVHAAVTISASTVTNTIGGGITTGSGCGTLGVLYLNPNGPGGDIDAYLQNTVIPSLGIDATTFPLFVIRNVVMSLSTPPNLTNCCVLGYHNAYKSPVQTYGIAEYDSSGDFGGGVADISVTSHEVGEWLDDPLGTNPTPPWGGIGQVSGCQSNWEVGDPLSGTMFPSILMANGVTYHPQELAFFGWYFDGDAPPAIPVVINGANVVGAGSKFSTNGTFTGPANVCPPGGTDPN
jgi:hypothetical protein